MSQVAVAPVPASVQVLNEPIPLDVSVRIPVGVVGPVAVSVTLMVQLVELLTTIVVG